jgi:hypothetical protein
MPCVHSDHIKAPAASRVAIPHPIFVWSGRPPFVATIVTLINAIREAQKLRRVLRKTWLLSMNNETSAQTTGERK